jgi:hypothetical protein
MLDIARAVGDRVLVIATSTGGTLAAYAATEADMAVDVAGIVFVSPNFALAEPTGRVLQWPLAGLIAQTLLGPGARVRADQRGAGDLLDRVASDDGRGAHGRDHAGGAPAGHVAGADAGALRVLRRRPGGVATGDAAGGGTMGRTGATGTADASVPKGWTLPPMSSRAISSVLR